MCLTIFAGSFHSPVCIPEFTQGRKSPGWVSHLPVVQNPVVTSHPALSLPERLSDPRPLPLFTVNSKAEVRFHLASAEWIAEPVRQKMAVTVTTGPVTTGPFLSL